MYKSNIGFQGQEGRSKVTRQQPVREGGEEDALPRGLGLFRDLQVKSTKIKSLITYQNYA